jgi:2,5-furandicarboxylate decarboxylase 1
VMLAAAISVERGRSELDLANALGPTRLMELEGHVVPRSEIVLLCRFTGELAEEGPFLDLTETYDIVRRQPVARVERIFTREGPMFHALLPGGLEHKVLMGMPREPTILREVSRVCECLDVYITPGGCSWLHAAVKIRPRDPGDGRRAIEAAFRGHASLKHVFVVDEDIDIEDPAAMEWAMATRFQADRDLVVMQGQKGSSLDPSSDQATKETAKAGFDLTIPSAQRREMFDRVEPPLPIDLDDYL